MFRKLMTALGASVILGGLVPASQAAAANQVVVPHGSAVQIAVALPFSGSLAPLGEGGWNAVQLAVEKHSRIRGFDVQLNRFDAPCANPGQNVIVANQVVANPQNVAVIGHFCSFSFSVALPVYEAADIVTLSGSVTGPFVPAFGPDVFNDIAISDACCPPEDNFGPWYNTVSQLPRDLHWRDKAYQKEFGASPPPFADLYYDAASLLLDKIASVASHGDDGSLLIDRATLARAVRATAGFDGVSCDITLGSNGYRVDDPVSLAKCASKRQEDPAAG